MDNDQYYPTPSLLARKMWSKFRFPIRRVLEPSAGEGALLRVAPFNLARDARFDAVEIDASRHAALKSVDPRISVVGHDFLCFDVGAIYSHIIMNPPFLQGAKHVLHAWEILYDGEIVALLNAETVRNPFSAERQLLVSLIERFGEVEFVAGAFAGGDAERKTDVEVAIVYLRKQADKSDLLDTILSDLSTDTRSSEDLSGGYVPPKDIAIPEGFVENSVRAFKAALEASRQAALAEAKAAYYVSLLGQTMAEKTAGGGVVKADISIDAVRSDIERRYENLKDRAWTNILRSTQVTGRVSQSAARQLEAEFEIIKRLEFTASNVYGFLAGLSGAAGEIQSKMVCDVFDLITRYHSENTVFYMGWKSNDKHRGVGWRIKTTRFIIPGYPCDGYRQSIGYNGEMMLADFDKVFAMLDGKREPEISLASLFLNHFNELRRGARLSSSYFDVRYYPGVGTIHFFPRSKALIDRMNRMVGRLRQWIPPSDSEATKAFWEQYEKADRFDSELRKRVQKNHQGPTWETPTARTLVFSAGKPTPEAEKTSEAFAEALTEVLAENGISVDRVLERPTQDAPLLELADKAA